VRSKLSCESENVVRCKKTLSSIFASVALQSIKQEMVMSTASNPAQVNQAKRFNGGLLGSRRTMLFQGIGLSAAAVTLAQTHAPAVAADTTRKPRKTNPGSSELSNGGGRIVTSDGTEIFYRDWGTGQPVVFSHGWPLTAEAFEDQMFFLASNGYRCIAHDRRGHGRSSQPWQGNDLDTYADDLAELVKHLDLSDAIHFGHSTGGGEVTRYIARHGTKRVSKAVLISAIPPVMLKSEKNTNGTPIEAFDGIRANVLADRSSFWRELAMPFYGYNRPGAKVSEGTRENFWLQSMMAGMPACYFCVKAFSETDLTEDLKKIDVPTLVLHGDDDQIVPIAASALLSAKLVKGAKLKIIKGAPHGMCTTHKDEVNAELLAFIRNSG
jgi:non-heme chloroperoxidase